MNFFLRYFVSLVLIVSALFALTASTAFASTYAWTNRTTGTSASGQSWTTITSSSDGTKLAAIAYGGDIWTSADSGTTWINRTTGMSASGLHWRDCAHRVIATTCSN